MIFLNFANAKRNSAPFPHVHAHDVLPEDVAAALVDWLDKAAPWVLTIAEFYEQHEFSLLDTTLPVEFELLASSEFVSIIADELDASLGAGPLDLVDISVHRLTTGMTVRIHNDFLGADESHRMLIQLNRGWSTQQGGLLMLFADSYPESLVDVVFPTHRSAFGFEISSRSHHAVSTIHAGVRDTIVYTFRKKH